MRKHILILCLLVLALCGILLAPAKKTVMRSPGTADESSAQTGQRATVEVATLSKDKVAAEPATKIDSTTTDREPNELDRIVAGLDDRDAEKREAARQAAMQNGDRNLIPALQVAAERTTDAAEKSALLAAVDFLELPSLSEVQGK